MWLHVNVVVCFSVCELTWYFSSSCVREIEMRWAIQANRVAVADIANTLHTLQVSINYIIFLDTCDIVISYTVILSIHFKCPHISSWVKAQIYVGIDCITGSVSWLTFIELYLGLWFSVRGHADHRVPPPGHPGLVRGHLKVGLGRGYCVKTNTCCNYRTHFSSRHWSCCVSFWVGDGRSQRLISCARCRCLIVSD